VAAAGVAIACKIACMITSNWRGLVSPRAVVCGFAASLVLAAVAPGQNITVPAALHGVEGAAASNVPFGSSLACRMQCIYDAGELPWQGPRAIQGISLRADNGTPQAAGTAIAAKGFLDVSVFLSTTYRTSSTMSATFADNRGEDVTLVLSYQRIQLPAQPAVGVGPRPANIDLMFPAPWFYGLTPARPNRPAPDNLLVEIWVHSQPAGSYRLDNLGGCIAVASDFGNQGPACTVPGATGMPTLSTAEAMLAGSNFTWTLTHGPANAPFVLALAASNLGGLFGQAAFPLPYPMFDPSNPSQPSAALAALRWPAPDCWFNIDPGPMVFGVCDATGLGNLITPLPAGRQNVGQTLFGQCIVLAQTANPLQLVTTLGRQSTICGPLGVARVHTFHSGTTPPISGTLLQGQAIVFEVR